MADVGSPPAQPVIGMADWLARHLPILLADRGRSSPAPQTGAPHEGLRTEDAPEDWRLLRDQRMRVFRDCHAVSAAPSLPVTARGARG